MTREFYSELKNFVVYTCTVQPTRNFSSCSRYSTRTLDSLDNLCTIILQALQVMYTSKMRVRCESYSFCLKLFNFCKSNGVDEGNSKTIKNSLKTTYPGIMRMKAAVTAKLIARE